jgi:hypothetical protein
MKIGIGIFSNTYVDSHGERMSKSALDGMAEQINALYIPLNIEHDRDSAVGVILYGEVFMLHDGEHALGGVFGIFGSPDEKDVYPYGQPNLVWEKYRSQLPVAKMVSDHAVGHASTDKMIPPVDWKNRSPA